MLFTEFGELGFGEYNNRKITVFNNDTMQNVKFQIPKMPMPFGISGFVPDIGPIKYNVEFILMNHKSENSYINKFYNFLKKIENDVITHVYENRMEILKKDYTFEEVGNMFNSNIKDKNDGYDPKFRVKVDLVSDTNEIKPTIYNEDKQILEDRVSRGLYSKYSGTAIVELCSIYFMNQKFGCTWKLSEMKIFEPKNVVKSLESTSPPLDTFSFREV